MIGASNELGGFVSITFCCLLVTFTLVIQSESKSDQTSTSTHKHDVDSEDIVPDRVKRGIFGFDATSPPYLKIIWSPYGTLERNQKDNRMLGYGIQVDRDTMLIHEGIESQFCRMSQGSAYQSMFTGSPSEVHINDGIPNHPEATHILRSLNEPIANSPYKLFKIDKRSHDNPEHDQTHIDRSKVERNRNQFGSDCHLYTYSRQVPGDRDGFRRFAVMPVTTNSSECLHGYCQFNLNSKGNGHLCSRMDRGSPILCGKDQKLTYLVTHNTADDCSRTINAYHVPRLTEVMYAPIHD